jgi:hypothetical protein
VGDRYGDVSIVLEMDDSTEDVEETAAQGLPHVVHPIGVSGEL